MKLKAVAVLLLFFFASTSEAVEGWQVASFDKAEALFTAFDKKEAALLTQYDPKIADFYAVFLPCQDAERKMRRYAFLKHLRQNPETINWASIWNWAGGRDMGTKEQEKLAAEDPAYRALREDFLAKKAAWKRKKDLTRIRNAEYEKHAEIFNVLEENLLKDLKALQADVDQRMSNAPPGPSR
ncbi:hypothetical protein GMSM_05260 [Geomonas sp. Red276]